MRNKLGIVVGGSIGHDPYHRLTWSGSSYQILSELQENKNLHLVAVGVRLKPITDIYRKIVNFHPRREVWRKQYYLDPAYLLGLTDRVQQHYSVLKDADAILQYGAMFNTRKALPSAKLCATYIDGTLSEYLRSPNAIGELKSSTVAQAQAFEREVYNSMDVVLTMSSHLAKSVADDYGVSSNKIVNIGFGHNLPFKINLKEKDYNRKDVLFIGKGNFRGKGGAFLLSAFQEVLKGRHSDAVLHLVGVEKSSLSDYRLPPRTVVHGILDKNEGKDVSKLADLFRLSSLFVLPSLLEGVGVSAAEAMLCGIPCITSDAWGFVDYVLPNKTGWRVPPGNAEALQHAIESALDCPQKLQTMGAQAAQLIESDYTWKRVVSRMLGHILG